MLLEEVGGAGCGEHPCRQDTLFFQKVPSPPCKFHSESEAAVSARRIILLAVLALLFFLGVYTWNQRTGQWDAVGAHTGLEISGSVMRVFHSAKDSVTDVWDRYMALVDVRERNDELEKEVATLRLQLSATMDDRAELDRLRQYLQMDFPREWPTIGARVLAWRMGPNSSLESLMLSRGYLTGATPGTPLISYNGLVGRVYKAGPSTAQALLITDPGSCVAVVASQGRVQGILTGGGAGAPLEMRFVRQNARVAVGEILLTSGLDSAYPKGVPVARVVSVSTGSSFMQEIRAVPLVNFDELEDVLLLERPAGWFTQEPTPVYTRRPAPISPDLGQEQNPANAVGNTLDSPQSVPASNPSASSIYSVPSALSSPVAPDMAGMGGVALP